jgi:hypothetical protein
MPAKSPKSQSYTMALTSKQQAKIAARAYKLYKLRGGVEGHALDDWLTAEADVLETRTISPWLQVLIVPVLVALVGAFVTYSYNHKQDEINRIQTMEKFIEYFAPGHPPEQQIAALVTLMKLGYTDQAVDLLLFAFNGQVLESHPAIVNFVQGYGPNLLPRLCTLVETSRKAEGFPLQSGIRHTAILYIRQIVDTDSGKTDFVNLITNRNIDEDTANGALYALNDVLTNSDWDAVFGLPESAKTAFINALRKVIFSSDYSIMTKELAVDALSKLKDSAERALQEIITARTLSDYVRSRALEAVVFDLPPRPEDEQARDHATKDLLQKIATDKTESATLRATAASIQAADLKSYLDELLDSEWPEDRRVALIWLQHFSESTSLPLLLSALKHEEDIDIKRRMVLSLTNYSDSDDVAELLSTTARKDPNPVIRQTACQSIAKWTAVWDRKNFAVEVLKDALGDSSLLVVDAALQGLTFSGTPAYDDLARKRIDAITDPVLKSYFETHYFLYKTVITSDEVNAAKRKALVKNRVMPRP